MNNRSPRNPTRHIPVMLDEVLTALAPKPGLVYVDATLGYGGHASAVLKHITPTGTLLGLDRDVDVLNETRQQLQIELQTTQWDCFKTQHGGFGDLTTLLKSANVPTITGGLLADLGVSSIQLDEAWRGFSFQQDGPLDMRMDRSQGITATDVVNTYSESQLVEILSTYGEERLSKSIAKAITVYRKATAITTTNQLTNLVLDTYQKTLGKTRLGRIHPATKVFQAIRIAVNDELGQLQSLIAALPSTTVLGARIVFLSFHSLEDRIIKHQMKALCQAGVFQPLYKKPIAGTLEETKHNPRSRSAKLRAYERL